MVQKIANGDAFPVLREVGEDIGEPVLVAQLAIARQQHDRHGGELLGARRQAEIGVTRQSSAGNADQPRRNRARILMLPFLMTSTAPPGPPSDLSPAKI